MERLVFKLNNDGYVIGSWSNRDEALTYAREYLSANPELASFIEFSTYNSTYRHGLKLISSLRGQDLVEFLEDADIPYDEPEED